MVVTEIVDIVEICHFVTTKMEHAQTDVNPDINNTIVNNVSQYNPYIVSILKCITFCVNLCNTSKEGQLVRWDFSIIIRSTSEWQLNAMSKFRDNFFDLFIYIYKTHCLLQLHYHSMRITERMAHVGCTYIHLTLLNRMK